MCSNEKRRDFCFVLKDFTQQEYELLFGIDCKYLILGKEQAETMLQGYIYFHCPRIFQGIKNLVPRIEMNDLKGNSKLNFEHCSKENNFEEKGKLPNYHAGKKIGSTNVIIPKETKKSFASHEKAKHWSLLNHIKPEDVCLNSHNKFWFDCPICNHIYQCALNNINIKNAGCPYCYNRKLCGKEECILCFNKSFASNEKAIFWSSKNEVKPIQVLKNSHKKYLFNCNNCNHEIEKALNDVNFKNTWCSYCANRVLCEEEKKCISCFNKTFASIDRSKYWSIKNKITPSKVFKNTAEKYWFDCDKCGNEFESKLCHVTDGSWCPKCRYKTEDKLNKLLFEKYPSLKSQYKVDWCKNRKHLPFDFVIEERKIIIEQDGIQHWKQVAKWKTPKHNRERDIYKMKCANENGFSVVRLLQEDVLFDKYDWLMELINNIEKISNETGVQNIYMCKKDEYKDFVIV
jgi:very-short-patch-repair endonuclease